MIERVDETIQLIRRQLHSARRVLVVSHIRPDGDAVGSMLGMGLALEAVGKDVQMVLSDRVPGSMRHLPGADRVRSQADGDFDLSIVVDCSDLERVGDALNIRGGRAAMKPGVNIDHHITNLNFADLNLVIPTAVSTSEILANCLASFELPLKAQVASALLTGIITDTLGFRTSNMTSQVLRTAAILMEAGADLPSLYHTALLDRSYEAVRYWGEGLCKLRREGSLVWTSLSLADRKAASYPGRDDADLINVLSSIGEADIVIIFVEQNNGNVKVSWRAQPGFDVSQVALKFGGGGHKAASGAEVKGSLPEVQEQVLHATRELLEE